MQREHLIGRSLTATLWDFKKTTDVRHSTGEISKDINARLAPIGSTKRGKDADTVKIAHGIAITITEVLTQLVQKSENIET